jgi:hypothetical protein
MRHASDIRIEAVSESGARVPVSPDAVKMLVRENISYLDIRMPDELLHRFELIDTPGFADPFQDSARMMDVIENADICVWCTLATQAWRQSERKIWLSLPVRFRASGILVVTHVDALAHQSEQERIRARLEDEVAGLFADIVLLTVPDAMRAIQADGRITDTELWRDSGGSALVAALQKAVTVHHNTRGQKVRVEDVRGFLWTGIGVAQAHSNVSPAATPAATMPTTGTPDLASKLPAASELQRFLATVMKIVPGCLVAAWTDLAGRQILEFRGPGADEIVETTALGEAITDLFQGRSAQTIEQLFKRFLGLAEDERHYFNEIVIITDDCIGVFLRHRSRTDRCLVIVSDRSVNLGMVLATTRSLMETTDLLI